MTNTNNVFDVLQQSDDNKKGKTQEQKDGFCLVKKNNKNKNKKKLTKNKLSENKKNIVVNKTNMINTNVTQNSINNTQIQPTNTLNNVSIESNTNQNNTQRFGNNTPNMCYEYQSFHRDVRSYDIHNKKKMLCNNILYNGVCNYNNKCMYAHNLDEQILDKFRKKAYDILNSNDDISKIDLIQDIDLYRTLIQLTKLCEKCFANQCPGGYNCKNGAISPNYVICYNDLVNGSCFRTECNYVHLTSRGLISYHVRENIYRSYGKNEKYSHIESVRRITPVGVILNDNIIKKLGNLKDIKNNSSDSDSDSELDMDVLDNSVDCETSIFGTK